jgi:serine protease Do
LVLMGAVAAGLAGQGLRAEDSGAVESARALSRAFRAAAKKVIPTVVKIKTTTKARRLPESENRPPRVNPFQGTPFEDFFNDDTPGFHFQVPHAMPQREGLGSGVIIDPKGIILTNNHVVEGADDVLVELADGRQFHVAPGEIKTDENSDLAVVRIKAPADVPAATLGDSDKMEIGDWVLAIGNPFDLDLTVSAGIISGKARTLPSGRRAEFLQTDAAINPGNSGGPLVNLDGEVVGINTAIASNSGGYQGVGFAIPVNLAKWVTAQLIKSGSVQRAYLGVKIEEITGELGQKLGVDRGHGVLVAEVYENTPAAKAGLREGDIIVRFAGHDVHNPRQLQEVVEQSPLGSAQPVEILRDTKPQTLSVPVSPLPKDFGTALAPGIGHGRGHGGTPGFSSKDLGLEVSDLSKELADRLGYAGFSGVVVTGVDRDGIAAEAGIREGMLILRVGKKPVRSAATFGEALKTESLANGILLLVRTADGGNRFIVLRRN